MKRIVWRILLIAALVMLLGTLFAVPALAASLNSGDIVNIAKGQVLNDDLYFAGRTLIVDGTVNGDIFCVADDVIINGTVNGGVTIAASTVIITGTITNGARIAAQTINVSGNIGRDLFVGASSFSLTGSVKRDLLFGSQNAHIGGGVDGNVKGGSQGATLSGKIGGDAQLWITQLNVANTAVISGKVTYTSNKPAIIQSGARINGTVTRLPQPNRGSDAGSKILGFFMIAVTGIIAVLLIGSARMAQMADTIRGKPWISLGWGALILIATPIAAVIIMITIIGLPLGLITLALYLIALYLSQIPVGLLIGRLILKRYSVSQAKIRTVVTLLLGLFLLLIVGFIPFLDVLIGLFTLLFGLGSLVLWLQAARHARTSQVTTG